MLKKLELASKNIANKGVKDDKQRRLSMDMMKKDEIEAIKNRHAQTKTHGKKAHDIKERIFFLVPDQKFN